MAFSFDLLTILTISGILAILAIYVIVVYKKGWLRKESKADQAYYLCPNQKCKRVFKKPVWLTDLSQTPPESFQACPHCGRNIQTIASPSSLASSMSRTASKPPLTPNESQSLQDKLPLITKADAEKKVEFGREPAQKHGLETSASHDPSRAEGSRVPKPIFHFPQIRKDPSHQQPPESRQKGSEKGSSDSPKKCSHFFGYVRTLPKNTPIPDECLWCPSIVDCLTHESTVEAEA